MMQRVIAGLIAILFITACGTDKLDVDTSGIRAEPVKVLRLDQDVFTITSANVESKTQELQKKYGNFYDQYIANFVSRNGTRDSSYKREILRFTTDKDILGCSSQVKKLYGGDEISKLEPEINDCIKRFKYHFPSRKAPERLITCITGWNYASAYADTSLILGLDMFLNDTSIYYQMLHLPQYRTRYMNRHYIVPSLAWAWMIHEFDNSDPVNTLLYHTIFYGKIHYAVNALLPSAHDTLLLQYSTPQYNYCKQYEKKLWGYFAEKNRLYENNMQTIHELTSEGPFTGAISKECPPRIAWWIGLQIVRSYMKNNEDVTVEQLMNEKDFQKILNRSKYRP